jgi:hypothetical protein
MSQGAEHFIQRVLSPRRQPAWWSDLSGEVRQRAPGGRYIKDTLEAELASDCPSYRTSPRHLYFFSTDARTSIDGRVGTLGVEEKYTDLTFPSVIDGALHRGIVWVLGNPHRLPADAVEAVALCVVRRHASPLIPQVSDALAPVLFSLARIRVHIVFIHEESGQHWMARPNDSQEPMPSWLAGKSTPGTWNLPPADPAAVASLTKSPTSPVRSTRLFDRQQTYEEYDAGAHARAAIVSWSNHWQMIEVGLLLRGAGYSAVKVTYRGTHPLQSAGSGVERAVRGALAEKFGVLLDWGVAV